MKFGPQALFSFFLLILSVHNTLLFLHLLRKSLFHIAASPPKLVSLHVWTTTLFFLPPCICALGVLEIWIEKVETLLTTVIPRSPATPTAFPSPVTQVLSSSSPEMAAPSVNETVLLGDHPPTSVPGQEISSLEEATTQTGGDHSNGVAATPEIIQPSEEIWSETKHVSQQADSAGVLSLAYEESVPPKEGLTEEESQESVGIEVANQEIEQISVATKVSGEEPGEVVKENPEDPNLFAQEEIAGDTGCGKTAEEQKRNLLQETTQEEYISGDGNVGMDSQIKNHDNKEPVILLSEAVQSKGTYKSEGPPFSTLHLPGWFTQDLSYCRTPCICIIYYIHYVYYI